MTTQTPEQMQAAMQQIVARCWSDADFKERLLKDPHGALTAEGYPMPMGVSIKAVENTAHTVHLVIPARPAELSDEDLDQASGGARICFSLTFSTPL